MAETMFAYDSSRQCLVFVAPRQPIGFQTRSLRESGWVGTDDDYRRALPRFGSPAIVTSQSMQEAQAIAAAQRQVRNGHGHGVLRG